MIVDCHSQIWVRPEQLGRHWREFLRRQGCGERLTAEPSDHVLSAEPADKTLVLGFRSVHLRAALPNDYLAKYIAQHSGQMIGIGAVDPTEEDCLDLANQLLGVKEFRGLTISPARQGFHPADSRAMPLYELAQQRGVPIFFVQHPPLQEGSRLEFARSYLLDEIARDFPHLTLVISGMGVPWVDETVAMLAKHPRVFADIAGLIRRPWALYNALVTANQYGVMDKVLFASDFPYMTLTEAVQGVYRLHEIVHGTNLPVVPREQLRSVVERDSLSALGIARPGETAATPQEADDEEEEQALGTRQ